MGCLVQVDLGGGVGVGSFKQCLQFSGSAVLNPVQYLNGLADAIVSKGGQIYEQTRVRNPDTHKVTTMAGNKVTFMMYNFSTQPCVLALLTPLLPTLPESPPLQTSCAVIPVSETRYFYPAEALEFL